MTTSEKEQPNVGHRDHRPDVGSVIQPTDGLDQRKSSPWTPATFRPYLVLSCASLCGCLNAYDGSLMGRLNAMPSCLHYFGMKSAGSSTGLVFSMYNTASVVAVFFTGPVNDYFGPAMGHVHQSTHNSFWHLRASAIHRSRPTPRW